jgi:hypothetical protein
LRKLIDGRLTFTPRGDFYEFDGVGTVELVLVGLVQKGASPMSATWNPTGRDSFLSGPLEERSATTEDRWGRRHAEGAMASPMGASWNSLLDCLRSLRAIRAAVRGVA